MPTELKKQTVDALTKEAKESNGLVVTAFKGLKTTEINEFRQKLRPLKGTYKIVKNSLTRIALKNAGMEGLAEALKGPSAIVIERGDAVATIEDEEAIAALGLVGTAGTRAVCSNIKAKRAGGADRFA